MTRTDPHEHSIRAEPYRKDDAVERALAAANDALAALPVPTPLQSVDTAELPIVYVVGIPRSGTTLLHQLIAQHLYVGYVDNVVARFWSRPSVGIALSRALHGDDREIELASSHGVSRGSTGPHEFGYFWRRWLQIDAAPTHHLDHDAQMRIDVDALGRTLRDELLAWWGRAGAFKNVICGFHAGLLTRAHPRSLFVYVKRDPLAVGRSILQARYDRYGSYDAWWSLKPSTWPFEGATPAQQVARQIIDCHAEFTTELAHTGVHAIELEYERLCEDPASALARVHEALTAVGKTEPMTFGTLPALRRSTGPELPAQLESDLRGALETT